MYHLQRNEISEFGGLICFPYILNCVSKILLLEITKKNGFSFGSLLSYSYLCQRYTTNQRCIGCQSSMKSEAINRNNLPALSADGVTPRSDQVD